MKKALKILLATILVLLVLIGGVTVYALIVYPPAYVYRIIFWNQADAYDYQKFPSRKIEKGGDTFYFDEGLDEERVRAAFASGAGVEDLDGYLAENGTQAFIVIQDDTILYEKYFNGTERDSIVTSFSVAKSFDSALVGIAIDEGHIDSVDDPITRYLPELAARDARFEKITIRDLLMMSSGIKYEEFPFFHGDDGKTYYYPDLREAALEETEITGEPGDEFLYNNYHPLLIGMILERTTGKSVSEYLEEKIWQQLGMEFDASWSLDSEESGFEKMESGINARAIDFARFGRLYLNGGDWEGSQVVPAGWVTESTSADESRDNDDYYRDEYGRSIYESGVGFYKYMWYGKRRDDGSTDFYAAGNHGQYIYVSPGKNLIIVRNGEAYGTDNQTWVKLFYEFAGAL